MEGNVLVPPLKDRERGDQLLLRGSNGVEIRKSERTVLIFRVVRRRLKAVGTHFLPNVDRFRQEISAVLRPFFPES